MCRVCLILIVLLIGLIPVGSSASDKIEPDPKDVKKVTTGSSDEEFLRLHKIATDGEGALAFLRKRFTSPLSEEQIQSLILQLGDDSFFKREEASQSLAVLGARAKKQLLLALNHKDLEIRDRAQRCLKEIEKDGLGTQLIASAIRIVARRKPNGASKLLLDQLPNLINDPLSEEIQQALGHLAIRDNKVDPVIVAALSEKQPVKRAAGAIALAQTGVKEYQPKLRAMLEDPVEGVRLRVALALVAHKEKDAIPVLISQMDRPFQRYASEAEDILFYLARDKSPQLTGRDVAARKKYREQWQAWWKANKDKVDFSLLEERNRILGRTVVVLLDENQVLDLDKKGKVRFKIDNVQMPLDLQPLPGDRVLLAEYRGNKVTERNSKGEVVWEKRIPEPLVAQRLINGNTFIATKDSLIEVDRAGKEVFSYTPPAGQQIMRARKLPSGDVLLITQLGVTHFVRLDRFGKEIKKFGVEVGTSGGRLDLTPKGNVLIPELDNNRVCEFDGDGKLVRSISVMGPIVAYSLPNGNVLATSMTEKRAVEIDPAGKEVWEYKHTTRVTRAIRY